MTVAHNQMPKSIRMIPIAVTTNAAPNREKEISSVDLNIHTIAAINNPIPANMHPIPPNIAPRSMPAIVHNKVTRTGIQMGLNITASTIEIIRGVESFFWEYAVGIDERGCREAL